MCVGEKKKKIENLKPLVGSFYRVAAAVMYPDDKR